MVRHAHALGQAKHRRRRDTLRHLLEKLSEIRGALIHSMSRHTYTPMWQRGARTHRELEDGRIDTCKEGYKYIHDDWRLKPVHTWGPGRQVTNHGIPYNHLRSERPQLFSRFTHTKLSSIITVD
jgi:hypothetical protein